MEVGITSTSYGSLDLNASDELAALAHLDEPAGPFDSADSLFASLVHAARLKTKNELECRSHKLLDCLSSALQCLLPRDVKLQRPRLAHGDLNFANILLDPVTGALEGIIDLELHAVLPSYLAADYPDWMGASFEPPENQATQRRLPPSQFTAYWFETPESAARWRGVFEAEAGKLSSEFMEALAAGRGARQLWRWLECWQCNEEYMKAFEEWMGEVIVPRS